MEKRRVVLIFLVSMLAFTFVPYLLTMNNPAFDGSAVMGFPVIFYAYGGFCLNQGTCTSFYPEFLVLDIAAALIVSLFIDFLIIRYKK